MKRRDFVKSSLLATSASFRVNSVLGCVNPALEAGTQSEFFLGFQNFRLIQVFLSVGGGTAIGSEQQIWPATTPGNKPNYNLH